jgi:hypothetical protein
MAGIANEDAAVANRTALSPGVSTQLNREPSQQELEVAQHLIEHSQGVPVQQPRETYAEEGFSQHAEGEQRENGGVVEGHHDLRDSLQAFHQAYPTSQAVQGAPLPHRRVPPSGAMPGGQMCRYVRQLYY